MSDKTIQEALAIFVLCFGFGGIIVFVSWLLS